MRQEQVRIEKTIHRKGFIGRQVERNCLLRSFEFQARENLRRACQEMAAKPEANNSQVPGSGTVPGDPPTLPQGPSFFFFPLVSPSPSSPVEPFFFTGAQMP